MKFETLERELYIMDEFTRAKVNMLESKINSQFKAARFQLFTENINGGLEECCNSLYLHIPYTSMNNSARINIGLDICNTLSDYYGVSLPCFIDNAEAVTNLFLTKSQQIRLIVSEPDKTLRKE